MKMPAILSKQEKAPILAVALLLLIAAAVVVIIQLRPGRPAGENSIAVSSELRRAVQQEVLPASEEAPVDRELYTTLNTDSSEYTGRQVVSMAQVLYDPQYTEEGIYFSFRSVSPEQDGHVLYGLAFWPGEDPGLSDRSYISMTGTLLGDYSYVDSYQFQDRGPALYLTELSLSSYGEIFAPAIITLFPQVQEEHDGCAMCLERVEFAKKESRFFVNLENDTGKSIRILVQEAEAFQDGQFYNCQVNYNSEDFSIYEEIPDGESRTVILTFPTIVPDSDILLKIPITAEYEALNSFDLLVEITRP